MRHDDLLFRRAYPRSPAELRSVDAALARIDMRDRLLDPEASGIAGTSVDMIVSWDMARWLTQRFPGTATIDWDEPPDEERLAIALTPHIPLLREHVADANIDYLEYATALGLEWYVRNLPAQTYDLLGLWVRWKVPREVSRTDMRRQPRAFFCDATILPRREISIARELAGPSLPIGTLSKREGAAVLDMARAAVLTRYRELYGFTWGDPSTIVSADAGRGLEIVLIGILPGKRLPLRAGFAPLLFRNGVPVGYGDAFGICERMEVSFNIFYAFREGESAYAFGRLLKLYHQLFGSTVFTIDPYQIGLGNEEAIEAGAFWFYRKLGFRPTDPKIEQLAVAEETRNRRSSPATLRRLAQSPLIYEMHPTGEWDRFQIPANVPLPPKLARAKRGRSEAEYLRLTAADRRFRRVLLREGSVRTKRL